MTKISVRQICFIMLAYTAATKLLSYPTGLSYFAGRDLLFPALMDFVVEGIIVWAVAFLCSRTDKTFFGLLEGTFGNVFARIIYGLFAAFFAFATIVPIFEQKLYVHTIFYDTVPSLVVFLPFFIFAVYAASKSFANIGRCADICLPVFVISMGMIFIMSFGEADWTNLLPILKTPANRVFGAGLGTLFRFNEPCWMLMFMGHFKYKKGDAAKITLSYAGAAVVVLVFLAMFYGIYGDIAASRTFAIARTSLYFPAVETIGRLDLIMLYILETVMLFSVVLNIQLAVHALTLCTGWDNRPVLSLGVNAVLAVILIVCEHNFYTIHMTYYNWMWIVFLIFTVIIPCLAWTLRRGKRNEEKV